MHKIETFLLLGIFAVGAASAPIAGAAEPRLKARAAYPSKPIRIISPLAPGGSADAIARMVGETLADAFGQNVVVDNRPGANGLIGIDIVAKATPDGYTLLVSSSSPLTVNPAMRGASMPFDVERDLIPITLIATQTFIAHVSPALPVKSIRDLIALAKAKPGAINYASAGAGSTAHMMAALFESLAHVKMTHVPYKGAAQGRIAVIARECDVMFDGLLAALPLIKAGRLRGLGVTSAKRSVVAPDIPTIAEAGVPGYSGDAWYGLLAPRGTPAGIVAKLSSAATRSLESPKTRERMIAQGIEPVGGTPQQFRAFLKAEIIKWSRVVKEAGVKAD